MKNYSLILFIVFCFSVIRADHFMTAQIPDKILFKGKKYALNSNPLEVYFEKFPEKRPKRGMMSTALWRGYIATFEIIENQLVVTDIEIQVPDKDAKDKYKTKWISVYEEVFPNSEKTKIDWYTGILILPYGKLVNYVHMGYASTYSKYMLLEIENGNFNESRKYNNKEFVEFKRRQFEAFKTTDAYKKIYTELKNDGSFENEDFIIRFIASYITNYTSKFLID